MIDPHKTDGAAVTGGDEHPSAFETAMRRIFAVGDVRCGSTKRVASAVGEGSVVVHFVRRRVALPGRHRGRR